VDKADLAQQVRFVLQFIGNKIRNQKLPECLFLKSAEKALLEELTACFMGIKARFKPAKTTSHNLYYVRFTVLGRKTDSG
jgi:hypothetical protein